MWAMCNHESGEDPKGTKTPRTQDTMGTTAEDKQPRGKKSQSKQRKVHEGEKQSHRKGKTRTRAAHGPWYLAISRIMVTMAREVAKVAGN